MYNNYNYTKTLGKYEQNKLQANMDSVVYNGAASDQIDTKSKTIKDIITSLSDSKYAKDFNIVDGKLAYIGDNNKEKEWSESINLPVYNDKTNVIILTTQGLPIKKGIDIVYILTVRSNSGVDNISLNSEDLSFMKKNDSENYEDISNSLVIKNISQVKGTSKEKYVNITIDTSTLEDSGEYKIKLKSGILKNVLGVKNETTISKNSFIIDNDIPQNPEILLSTTVWTNQDILVTINYPEDSKTKEYNLNSDSLGFREYTGSFIISENTNITAKAVDLASNESFNTMSVTIIDKENPEITISPNGMLNVQTAEPKVSALDNSNVFESLQYVWTTNENEPLEGWMNFENNSILTKDQVTGDYYLWIKAIDKAGNITTKKSEVFKIDSTVPEAPSMIPNIINWTNQNVILTISYPTDAIEKEYSYDSNNWITYTEALTIDSNKTIYARCTDYSQNQSPQSSITISNIDKVSPIISYNPNGSSSGDAASTNVTVSDSGGSQINTLRYIWDTQNQNTPSSGWNSFNNGQNLSISSINGTYYLWIEATDKASNITITKSNAFVVNLRTEDYENGSNTVFSYSGNWSITTASSYSTTHSYTNRDINDDGSSSTTFTYNNITTDGYNRKISLYYKVSSELNFDFLTIYINGVSVLHVSGEVGWTYFEAPLAQGNNTIRYTYSKDGSTDRGSDCAYIDNVKIQRSNLLSPTFIPDKTAWTNQNVNVTINYPVSATNYQYSLNGSTWYNYTTSLSIPNNMVVYAKCSNNSGITSAQSSISITNIDKTPPVVNYSPNTAVRLVVTDAGGSNVNTNTLQYEWSTSNEVPNSGWISFTNGADITRQNDKNLWAKYSDIAGNVVTDKLDLNSTITENYDIPNYTMFSYSGNWSETSTSVYNGSYSYTNRDINDDGSSSTTFTYNNITTDGYNRKISLYYKVSSELNFDFLTIYINGVSVLHVSGEVGWTYFEAPLAQGNNTIRYTYSKDGSTDRGSDCAYIDNVKIQK